MYYDKRICYIDYLENGEKRRNCGYVKVIVTGGRLLLEMQIKGLYMTDDVASEVMLEGAGAESRIGTVIIRQGSGNFRWEMQDPVHQGEEISLDEGLSYGRLERVVVHLSAHRSLCCIWREPKLAEPAEKERDIRTDEAPPIPAEAVPETDASQGMAKEQRTTEGQPETELSSERQILPEPPWEQMEAPPEPAPVREELPETEEPSEQEAPQEPEPPEQPEPPAEQELHTAETRKSVPPEPPAVPMSEDKWQQLWRIYPHIRPFQDGREYLSLRPQDFVILRSDAYRLVQNSFLLHGFYNYKHLILTHVSQKNMKQYYIGVPGNFYEKEKQVAVMYGFDSFECREETAREGDFGYYMIRVEL